MMKQILLVLCVTLSACVNVATGADALPEKGAASTTPAARWEQSFVTGNGRMGAMLLGNPENETFFANHCRLYVPLGSYEKVPDMAAHMPTARQMIRDNDPTVGKRYEPAMEFLTAKAAEQGFPGIIWTDMFHPGLRVHVRQRAAGEVRDYLRTQDFRTGEVAVHWKDDRGGFRRRLFVSRTQNVIVFSMTSESKGQLTCDLQFPIPGPIEKKESQQGKNRKDWGSPDLLLPKRDMAKDRVTFHNTYARGKGGFDVATRIVVDGGDTQVVDTYDRVVRISGANEVLMLVRIVPWKTPLLSKESDAWAYSTENPDFSAERLGRFEPIPELSASSVVPYRTAMDASALLPQLVKSLEKIQPDYDALFAPHREQHAELFDRVSIDLEGGEDRAKTSEELLNIAVNEKRLPAALAEKIYDGGRYMFICCAGEMPPNLQGIWAGHWRSTWSGDFTLDTNLQLATKHAYTAGLGELMQGYFRMIEDCYPEWRLNAERIYGCPGYLTNIRASNTTLMLHWGTWPGLFWTGGCGWLARPFYDDWQFTGDETFLETRTVPLLKEVASFYEEFMILDPNTGRYEFIPSLSPESGAGINSTMDVMICKDVLKNLIAACRALDIEHANIPKWEVMLSKLPDYRINGDGALAEWIQEGAPEMYWHRHLSHLHSCYEGIDDLDPQRTPELWAAAKEALMRRINCPGAQASSHGRSYQGLSAAFLRMPEVAYGRLEIMATRRSMFPSMITAHDPDEGIFNCDGNGAMPEIMHRMILQSRPGLLDLLPALPKAWPRGELRGTKARQRITINRLAWDRTAGRLTLQLTSDCDQEVVLQIPNAETILEIDTSGDPADVRACDGAPNCRTVALKSGETVEFRIRASF